MTVKLLKMIEAEEIIAIARSAGLADIGKWVNASKVQSFLDSGLWQVFAAVDGNSKAGIIAGGIEDEGRMSIEIMAVEKKYRRRGIGKLLIKAIVQIAEEKSLRGIFVDVDDDNYGARKFYKKAGFKRAGKIKHYYFDSSTAIIYWLQLRTGANEVGLNKP